jgi:type III secretion protein J
MSRKHVLACLASGAVLFTGACAVPLAGGLDDAAANRVVFALDRVSVDATKEVDPAADGRFRVSVARDDVPRALSALADEGLPRSFAPGILDAVGKGSLVPSEATERAQLVAAIAGELERSIEGIEGVVSARVHISEPAPALDRAVVPVRPCASVLLQHRGSTPPLSADELQRIVAGGVAGMLPGDVAVVMIPRSAPPLGAAGALGHVGPIAVARTSLRNLQAALVILVALIAGLAAATLALYARLARAHAALAAVANSDRPAARSP